MRFLYKCAATRIEINKITLKRKENRNNKTREPSAFSLSGICSLFFADREDILSGTCLELTVSCRMKGLCSPVGMVTTLGIRCVTITSSSSPSSSSFTFIVSSLLCFSSSASPDSFTIFSVSFSCISFVASSSPLSLSFFAFFAMGLGIRRG